MFFLESSSSASFKGDLPFTTQALMFISQLAFLGLAYSAILIALIAALFLRFVNLKFGFYR